MKPLYLGTGDRWRPYVKGEVVASFLMAKRWVDDSFRLHNTFLEVP